MLGAVFAGIKALNRRKSRSRNPRTGLVKRKRKPAFLRGKKGQPLGGRRTRKNPKEVSIQRIREPRRTPGKPRPTKPVTVHKDPKRTPGKPKSAGTTKRTPEQIALINKYTHGDPRRTSGKPKSTRPVRVQKDPRRTSGKPQIQEPSKTERVSKERPSKVQPRVRKRRKSKGPSYTSTSLNV